MLSVSEVDFLVGCAHAGQVDKIGHPYVGHVRAVAAGLAPFGDELVMAGLLHDVVEDTDWTAEKLLASGIPPRVVEIVGAVTMIGYIGYDVWGEDPADHRRLFGDAGEDLRQRPQQPPRPGRPAPAGQARAPGGETRRAPCAMPVPCLWRACVIPASV